MPLTRVLTLFAILGIVAAGCGRQEGPSPPPIDSTEYTNQHEAWLAEQLGYLSEVLPVTGIWPIDEGETMFGSDPAVPVVLPAAGVAARAGTFRRVGDTVTVVPLAGAGLRLPDGTPVESETEAEIVTFVAR